ncbi:MAG: STT3 domain-containing protein [Nanoarchaeota archaeon]|nr:STT3 domain-containing protein [Nanoarchaeota archaeon]
MEENKENNFTDDKGGMVHLSEEALIKNRKEKVLKFIKKRYALIVYAILILIVLLSIQIRILPMEIDSTTQKPKLWDISTDSWTLGPDLDPFLFLRWSEYIVDNGELFSIDPMRYAPLGYDVTGELLLHTYLMVWFHKVASLFGSESITYSAIIYPVFMFALTVIAFFLFTRKAFIDTVGKIRANIIALISSFFLTVLPVFLPRTIAGIPEKEASAFLFMFLSFYFFLCAWKFEGTKGKIIFAILAGLSTGSMALIWGGYSYVFIGIAAAVFLSFLLGNLEKRNYFVLLIWNLAAYAVMIPFPLRYSIKNLMLKSSVIVAVIILIHMTIFNTQFKKYFENKWLNKIPSQLISVAVASIALSILATIFLGIGFIPNQISNIVQTLISPISSRLIQTVAENRQPFFVEWVGNFGPVVNNFPIFFWLFFIGSILLFYQYIKALGQKERFYLTGAFIILISSICFSRYSGNSVLDGSTKVSLIFYALGFILFIGICGIYYFKNYKKNNLEIFKNIDFSLSLVIILFLLGLISARGLIRLVMILAPFASMVVAYFAVLSVSNTKKSKDDLFKIFTWIIAIMVIIASLFSGWQFYKEVSSQASVYAPSIYTQQWQKAMGWVRDNTPQNSIFGHWWDYGYWVQSMGKRSTVLDGGNAISYWNHLMGRYALTGNNEREALEFLYAHNTTHFLIDSSDIGKYSAFSLIGSDTSYDRASNLPTFIKDKSQIQETKNSTIYLYTGGIYLDQDIIYEQNGSKLFLPAGKAGLGALLVEKDSQGVIIKVDGIYVYQENQYRIPLKYAFSEGKLYEFDNGLEAGIYLMPLVEQTNQQLGLEKDGALIYLSQRTVNSQLARLYFYDDKKSNFNLVHSEDDFLVAQLKAQSPEVEDIIYYGGVRGPIKIWEINYPEDIEFKEEYLSTVYPEELEVIR